MISNQKTDFKKESNEIKNDVAGFKEEVNQKLTKIESLLEKLIS
jgi:predicted  nucleic acid-binding Zn-ribbon protein